jgi:glucose/arabinose dehydrogenase
MIKAFDLGAVPEGGYDFKTTGEVFAYGVRDPLEFVEDSQGVFWNVDNGADAFTRNNVSVGAANPADELNRLGVYGSEGPAKSFGFPLCHQVWNVGSPDQV